MRILQLSWEYPPQIIGGLGRHVQALSAAQASNGHEVVVLTASTGAITGTGDGQPPVSRFPTPAPGSVEVVRLVPGPPRLRFSTEQLLAWVAGLEHAMVRGGLALARSWRPDVVHCHDWMVAQAGNTLAAALGCPMVATIHATEAGRAQGWVSSPLNAAVHGVEWWLAHTADAVIACSEHMAAEICRLFDLAPGTPAIIPNGIDLEQWRRPDHDLEATRSQYVEPGGHLMVYTGRVEWEKGVQTLIAALPTIQASLPGTRLVVTGRGTHLPSLQSQADRLGLAGTATFTGWLPEDQMHALVASADLAVVPSLYEPFGLVALEAAALRTPLLVAATGGLAEFAGSGRYAGTFTPGDQNCLASEAVAALTDPSLRTRRVDAATAKLRRDHLWSRIATSTDTVYEAALERHRTNPERAAQVAIPHFQAPMGNLLTGEPPG
jgi:glycogen(starch) synthase